MSDLPPTLETHTVSVAGQTATEPPFIGQLPSEPGAIAAHVDSLPTGASIDALQAEADAKKAQEQAALRKQETERRAGQVVEDIQLVGNTSITRALNKRNRERDAAAQGKKKDYSENPQQAAAERAYDSLMDWTLKLSGLTEGPLPLVDASAAGLRMIGKDGKPLILMEITTVQGNTFLCKNHNGTTVSFSREEFMANCFVTERQALLAGTPAAQRPAMEVYLKMTEDRLSGREPTLPNGVDVAAAETAIATAGRSMGFVTGESAQSFIRLGAKDDLALEAELSALVAGQTILDPETLGTLVYKINRKSMKLETLKDRKSQAEHELAIENTTSAPAGVDAETTARWKMTHDQRILELNAAIQHADAEIGLMEQFPQTEEALTAFFRKVSAGEIPLDDATMIDEAIANGKTDRLFQELLEQIPEGPDKERFKQLAELAKFGGMALIGVVAMVLMQALTQK